MFAYFGLGIQEILILLGAAGLFIAGPVIGLLLALALARWSGPTSEPDPGHAGAREDSVPGRG